MRLAQRNFESSALAAIPIKVAQIPSRRVSSPRPHLTDTWRKDGPLCRVCAGASDHRRPIQRVLDRLFGGEPCHHPAPHGDPRRPWAGHLTKPPQLGFCQSSLNSRFVLPDELSQMRLNR